MSSPEKPQYDPSEEGAELDPKAQAIIETLLEDARSVPHELSMRDRKKERDKKHQEKERIFDQKVTDLERWFDEEDRERRHLPEMFRNGDKNEYIEDLFKDARERSINLESDPILNIYNYFSKQGYEDVKSVVRAIDNNQVESGVLKEIILNSNPVLGLPIHEWLVRAATRSYRRAQKERDKKNKKGKGEIDWLFP